MECPKGHGSTIFYLHTKQEYWCFICRIEYDVKDLKFGRYNWKKGGLMPGREDMR